MFKFCRVLLISAGIAVLISVAALVHRGGVGIVILIALIALAILKKRSRQRLTAFGTARWANAVDLRKAGMLNATSGLIIGRLAGDQRPSLIEGLNSLFDMQKDSETACRTFLGSLVPKMIAERPQLVRLPHAVHTAVFAPTGAGKGVSIANPFLFTCDDSCVVLDFGAQLARTTAAFRLREFNHRIVLYDPFKIFTAAPDTYNAVAAIDKNSPTAIDDVRALAETQVIRAAEEREPHFPDAAEMWIAAAIAAVVQYGDSDDRSLQTVRELLGDPRTIDVMKQLLCESDAWQGMLKRLGYQLLHFKDRELGSTLTTVNRYLRYLDTPAVAESTRTSSFNPSELTRSKVSVYLILPLEFSRTQSPILRTWLSGMLSAVVRNGLQEHNKVHFLLDEAASLGKLSQLEDALERYRAYGVRLKLFYQSPAQLKKCFPEGQDQNLLANVTQTYFSINDLPTAEQLSNRLGDETIIIGSGGTSHGDSYQQSGSSQSSNTRSGNLSNNWQQNKRRLLTPDEIISLPERTAITFARGVPAILTTLTPYFEEVPSAKRPQDLLSMLGVSLCLFLFCGMVALAIARAPTPQPHYRARPAASMTRHSVNER